MSMIRVEKLSKAFGSLQVLKDVDLTVEKGERIVIIGGSGCGKSVFLRCMDFLEIPDEGAVFLGDDELTTNQKDLNRIRRKVGMVFQGFHLFSHMNVLDNITLAPIKLLGLSREEAEKKAEALLKMVGLESKKYTMPDVLSGGQKQRIAIVRCLAMEPEVKLIVFMRGFSLSEEPVCNYICAMLRFIFTGTVVLLTPWNFIVQDEFK